jgi:hypothetical protein
MLTSERAFKTVRTSGFIAIQCSFRSPRGRYEKAYDAFNPTIGYTIVSLFRVIQKVLSGGPVSHKASAQIAL